MCVYAQLLTFLKSEIVLFSSLVFFCKGILLLLSTIMSGRNRLPFTAIQWQELEQQALIFKYMVSGFPIPPDLLFTLKASLDSKLILHQPHQNPNVGWNCFQMGFGRKIDPEPGRCRRTDGKKWRCSKEAFPDSKYCERHMHRGRNRSRKPVEVTTPPLPLPLPLPPPPSPPPRRRSSPSKAQTLLPISPFSTHHHHHHHTYNTHPHHHSFLYSHSSSSRSPGIDLSSQENTNTLVLDSGPCFNTDKDYRYGCGKKQEVDEHAFFSQSSGTVRSYYPGSSMDDPLEMTPLTMGVSSLAHLKQRTCSGLQTVYPLLQPTHDQYFHVLGSGIKGEMPLKTEKDEEPQKIMHHFLDECPKNRDPWLDSEDKSSSYVPISATQLSISTPNSSYDFFHG